ncbi:AcrR family transcriptional regulator [Bradyrhizobium sp. LM3.4]
MRSDEETKQIVFEAARHAFAVDGYAATSTEELARGAGISTKTLYRLFPGKAVAVRGDVRGPARAVALCRRSPGQRRSRH